VEAVASALLMAGGQASSGVGPGWQCLRGKLRWAGWHGGLRARGRRGVMRAATLPQPLPTLVGDYRVTRLLADPNLPNAGSPSWRGTVSSPDFPADGRAVSKPFTGEGAFMGRRVDRAPWGEQRRDGVSSHFLCCVSIRAFGIGVV